MAPSMSKACSVFLLALGCASTASSFVLTPLLHNSKATGTAVRGNSVVQTGGVGRTLLLPRHQVPPTHGVVLMEAEGGDGKKETKAAREVRSDLWRLELLPFLFIMTEA